MGRENVAQDESKKTGYVIKEKCYQKIGDLHDHVERGGQSAHVWQSSVSTAKGKGCPNPPRRWSTVSGRWKHQEKIHQPLKPCT